MSCIAPVFLQTLSFIKCDIQRINAVLEMELVLELISPWNINNTYLSYDNMVRISFLLNNRFYL